MLPNESFEHNSVLKLNNCSLKIENHHVERFYQLNVKKIYGNIQKKFDELNDLSVFTIGKEIFISATEKSIVERLSIREKCSFKVNSQVRFFL